MPALWMLLASFAFSAMGAAVKLASSYYSTSEIVMYRGLVGTLMLIALVRHQGGTFKTQFPRAHLWRCFVGVTSLWLWFYAISKLPLATAVTLNYMAPIWMAVFLFVLGVMQRKNHVGWPMIAALTVSFIGVVLVLQPAFAADQWLGGAAGLLSGVISAFAYMQVRQLGKLGEPEYRVVFYFSLVTAIAGLGAAAFASAGSGTPILHGHDWHSGALLVVLGVSATIAQMAMTRSYRYGKVLVVANLQYVGIVFSSGWGMLLWGDRFDWHVWLGIAMILISGIAATFYNNRNTEHDPAVAESDPIASEL